jgi:hypothetical protein
MDPAMTAWLEEASTPRFWAELNPQLRLAGSAPEPYFDVGEDLRQELLGDLLVDGYFQLPPCLPTELVGRLAEGVRNLHRAHIPPVFIFVYEELWDLTRGLAPLISTVLGPGFRALPDMWAWCIEPRGSERGWQPHRDRDFHTLEPNGLPGSLSLWIPLTDATPLNGCIYCLPACRDPNYLLRRDEPEVPHPQDARALPAAAGSVLGWNQALLHWGGRASGRARVPRISVSMELQRGDRPPLATPLLDPQAPPAFERRLGLVGHQILQYPHMQDPGVAMESVATWLLQRFPI